MLLLRFHPHESAWWAPLNRFYAGLAGIAETCIGPILRVLHLITISLTYTSTNFSALSFLFTEIKCRLLVSLSTITHILPFWCHGQSCDEVHTYFLQLPFRNF